MIMPCKSRLLLLLTVFGVSLAYNIRQFENDLSNLDMYQAANEIDTGPPKLYQHDSDNANGLLERLLKSEQLRDLADNYESYRTKLSLLAQKHYVPFPKNESQKETEDITEDKRGRPKEKVRPQPKWKIKKGRQGSQIVCYFKLCAFRSPS